MARRGILREAADALRYRTAHLHLWRLVTRVLSHFGLAHLFLLYRMDLTRPLTPYRARVPLTIGLAAADEIDAIAGLLPDEPELVPAFRLRVRRGHRCFVARVADGGGGGGEVAGYNWTCFKAELIPGRVILLKPDEIYTNDAYTVPAWRGRGIHTELNHAMLQAAKEAGYRTAYTLVTVTNTTSWIALARLGWRLQGAMLFFMRHGTRTPRTWCVSGSLHPTVDIHAGRRTKEDGRPDGRGRSSTMAGGAA